MKKIIVICGLIAGLISSAWCFISVRTFSNEIDLNARTWLGYTAMILSFSLIFIAVKQYKDNHSGGFITFGKAFKIGLMVTLIGSTLYVGIWLISYYLFFPNFAEKYASLMRDQMKSEGANPATIAKEMVEMAKFSSWYHNPLFNILITYSEILPVGLIMSLIAAAILRRKPTLNLQGS